MRNSRRNAAQQSGQQPPHMNSHIVLSIINQCARRSRAPIANTLWSVAIVTDCHSTSEKRRF
jgi:hypothetical protein